MDKLWKSQSMGDWGKLKNIVCFLSATKIQEFPQSGEVHTIVHPPFRWERDQSLLLPILRVQAAAFFFPRSWRSRFTWKKNIFDAFFQLFKLRLRNSWMLGIHIALDFPNYGENMDAHWKKCICFLLDFNKCLFLNFHLHMITKLGTIFGEEITQSAL